MDIIFKKNLEALKERNPSLFQSLSCITSLNSLEVFQAGDNPTDLDIFNHDTQSFLYQKEPQNALKQRFKHVQNTQNYLYLYYFGIGNGFFIQALLLSHNAKRIVVIEPNIEYLYIALHLIDFSLEISQGRLELQLAESLTFHKVLALFLINEDEPLWHSANLKFELFVEYKEYIATYISVDKLIKQARDYVLSLNNADIQDTLKGIRQTSINMKALCSGEALSKVFDLSPSKQVIIVSTGPSLTKQLPLLKSIQNYATIISVDASLPILFNAGIKPHFVVSMERDEPTSKFFLSVPKAFKKGVNFICSSVQHVSVLNAIDEGNLFVTLRPHRHFRFFDLNEYGYLGAGMSAANMALDLAISTMRFKEIVFIGQDLAFGEKLQTHASGHVIESNASINKEIQDNKLIEIPAYGGKGKVSTHMYWKIFKEGLESTITQFPSQIVINATEGGARIEGSIEKDFSLIVKEILEACLEVDINFNKQNETSETCLQKYETSKKSLLTIGELIEEEMDELLQLYKKPFDSKKLKNNYAKVKKFDEKLQTTQSYKEFFLPILNPSLTLLRMKINEIATTLYEDEIEMFETIMSVYEQYFTNFREYHAAVLKTLK